MREPQRQLTRTTSVPVLTSRGLFQSQGILWPAIDLFLRLGSLLTVAPVFRPLQRTWGERNAGLVSRPKWVTPPGSGLACAAICIVQTARVEVTKAVKASS